MKSSLLKFFYLFYYLFFSLQAISQTQVSPKYSVDGTVSAMATYGDTLILGGNFTYTGIYTGGGAMFTTTNDQPTLTFPKILGTIASSTPDGQGGYYVYGNFSKEAEPDNSYRRIEHILPNYTWDSTFSFSAGALFGLSKLLYHNGILYIGGSYVDHIGSQPANDLCAIDVATKQLVTWLPAVVINYLGGVSGLYIHNNTLYITGSFNTVGTTTRKNIAAIELYSGNVKPWDFAANWSGNSYFSDIDFYQNKIVISGGFSDGGSPGTTGHGYALTDSVTGSSIDYIFNSNSLFGTGLRAYPKNR